MTEWQYISRRMVLREPDGEEEVIQFADEFNMKKIRDVSAPERQGIVREIAWQVSPEIKMHYAMDYLSSCSFVVVYGEDNEETHQLVHVVEEILDPWTKNELLEEVDAIDEPNYLAQAVIRAGVGAPNEYDEGFFQRISHALRSRDTWVRRAAIWATAYSRWPQFLPILREIADTDPDETLRNEARRMVDFDDSKRET